jgi:hypothetical protein
MVDVLHEEVLHVLAEQEGQLALNGIVLEVLLSGQVAVRDIPGIEAGGGIVLDVCDRAAPLQHERAQAGLGQLLGRPSSGHAGAHDDRVVGLLLRAYHVAQAFCPGRSGRHPRNPPGTAS